MASRTQRVVFLRDEPGCPPLAWQHCKDFLEHVSNGKSYDVFMEYVEEVAASLEHVVTDDVICQVNNRESWKDEDNENIYRVPFEYVWMLMRLCGQQFPNPHFRETIFGRKPREPHLIDTSRCTMLQSSGGLEPSAFVQFDPMTNQPLSADTKVVKLVFKVPLAYLPLTSGIGCSFDGEIPILRPFCSPNFSSRDPATDVINDMLKMLANREGDSNEGADEIGDSDRMSDDSDRIHRNESDSIESNSDNGVFLVGVPYATMKTSKTDIYSQIFISMRDRELHSMVTLEGLDSPIQHGPKSPAAEGFWNWIIAIPPSMGDCHAFFDHLVGPIQNLQFPQFYQFHPNLQDLPDRLKASMAFVWMHLDIIRYLGMSTNVLEGYRRLQDYLQRIDPVSNKLTITNMPELTSQTRMRFKAVTNSLCEIAAVEGNVPLSAAVHIVQGIWPARDIEQANHPRPLTLDTWEGLPLSEEVTVELLVPSREADDIPDQFSNSFIEKCKSLTTE